MYDLPIKNLSTINDFNLKSTQDDIIYMTALNDSRIACRVLLSEIALIDELTEEYKALDALLYVKLPLLTQKRIDLVKTRQVSCEECGTKNNVISTDSGAFCVNCAKGMK